MKKENIVVKKSTFEHLAPCGRGRHGVPGEGVYNKANFVGTPSSPLRGTSPARGEVNGGGWAARRGGIPRNVCLTDDGWQNGVVLCRGGGNTWNSWDEGRWKHAETLSKSAFLFRIRGRPAGG